MGIAGLSEERDPTEGEQIGEQNADSRREEPGGM